VTIALALATSSNVASVTTFTGTRKVIE